MARTADPERRLALLDQIIEHLLDQPLATLSFRTLASALGVSTYTLVYQFGTRAELLHEIVRALTTHQNIVVEAVASETGDFHAHLENLRASWAWFVQPRNQQLLRLEIEASMLEALDPGEEPITPRVFQMWHDAGRDALVAMGIDVDDADIEARVITNTIYGMQHDVIVNGDVDAATAAFERVLQSYAKRIRALMPGGENDDGFDADADSGDERGDLVASTV